MDGKGDERIGWLIGRRGGISFVKVMRGDELPSSRKARDGSGKRGGYNVLGCVWPSD